MEKILFVDSYTSLLDLYKEEFSDDGFEVILARNGKEALSKYRKRFPHLVVMDLHLPDMEGTELLNSILDMDSKASIIIHDAHRHQEDFRTWMAEAHVIKSFDFSRLKNEVRKVISNSEKSRDKGSVHAVSP